MTAELAYIRNNVVVRNASNQWRWYDAFGENVVKYVTHWEAMVDDDTTGDISGWTTTVVEVGAGSSTGVLTTTKGGALLITAAANENDGAQYQLKGEAYQLNLKHQCYFGCEFALGDADQSDAIVGLCITDTTLLGGLSDGAYFRTVDESAVLQFVLEKNSTESATNVGTLTDATNVTAEFFYDGTNITAYINGTQQAQIAVTDAAFPNDEVLTPSIAFLTGEAVANTMTLQWARWIQVQVAA